MVTCPFDVIRMASAFLTDVGKNNGLEGWEQCGGNASGNPLGGGAFAI
jgi:hypothetical protein